MEVGRGEDRQFSELREEIRRAALEIRNLSQELKQCGTPVDRFAAQTQRARQLFASYRYHEALQDLRTLRELMFGCLLDERLRVFDAQLSTLAEEEVGVVSVENAGSVTALASDGVVQKANRLRTKSRIVGPAGRSASVRARRKQVNPSGVAIIAIVFLFVISALPAGFVGNASADGTGSPGTQLTSSPEADTAPLWSPDGATIVLTRRPEGMCCSAKLWAMDSDGSNQRQLSFGTLDEASDFSPDGSKVAFIRWPSSRGDYTEVMSMNADGSGIVQLTSGGSLTYNWPRWSHDGRQIVGHGIVGTTGSSHVGTHRLWIMNVDGSGLTVLLERGYSPVFFPGDEELVFSDHDYEETTFTLATLSLADGTIAPLTSGPVDMQPDVSPDGSRVAFSRCVSWPPNINTACDIYLVNRDGTGLTRITTDGKYNTEPRFSPSGREIAYVSSRSGNRDVWKMMANVAPLADFKFRGPETSFTPSTIYVGSSAKFDAEASYDPDGTIMSYTWDLGDGTSVAETDEVTYHVYAISGPYTVTLTVRDDGGASGTVSKGIFIHPLQWHLVIELDYMSGHRPTDSALNYVHSYFQDNGIDVLLYVDDEISPADPRITESEFWVLESQYNDVVAYDDRALGKTTDAKFFLKEKWVLYGAATESEFVGFTKLPLKEVDKSGNQILDDRAGNYIFVADETIDDWASSVGVPLSAAETVILMHEIGHAIGMFLQDKPGTDPDHDLTAEDYDNAKWSVMALLDTANVLAQPIRYSSQYWHLKNLEFYAK